jgi:hypothetical protein
LLLCELNRFRNIAATHGPQVVQFLSEAFGMSALGAAGALLLALPLAPLLSRVLGVPMAFDANVVLLVLAGSVIFAALGSLYPVAKGWALRPLEAMRELGQPWPSRARSRSRAARARAPAPRRRRRWGRRQAQRTEAPRQAWRTSEPAEQPRRAERRARRNRRAAGPGCSGPESTSAG